MSALSVSSVAASGSSVQAPAQPGAPDATAADASPFALLLAAVTAADPDLQTALPADAVQAQAQSGATQLPNGTQAQTDTAQQSNAPQPPSSAPDARTFPSPGVQIAAANDDSASDSGDTTMDPNADIAQPSLSDSDAAPKAGSKPDKKANADNAGADATINLLQAQNPAMLQPPIAPVAQAAVQTQTVASNDDDGDIPATGAIGAAAPTSPAQSSAVPGNKPIAPGPDASRPVSPPPSQPFQVSQPGGKQIATQPVAQPLVPANDDGTDDDADVNNAVAALQTTAHVAGTKFAQAYNPPAKPTNQTATQPQAPAAADDADVDTEPSAAQGSTTSTLSPTAAQAPQPATDDAAQNTVAVFTAQQTPQKPAATGKPTPDKVSDVGAPPANATNTNAAASANDPAQGAASPQTVTVDKDSDGKSAHAATSTAPQPQTDAPPSAQQPAGATAMPQTTVAINAAGTPSQNGPTLTVHIASHASDSQPGTPSTVTPNTDALAISVAARSLSGSKQFDIRLDPPELGRVDVRLSIDASGKTQAHMTTDQPRTLELLQKDAPNLTRALRDAGLNVSQNGLNFSLKGQSQNQGGQGNPFAAPSRSLSLPATVQTIENIPSANTLSSLLGNARLDIHV